MFRVEGIAPDLMRLRGKRAPGVLRKRLDRVVRLTQGGQYPRQTQPRDMSELRILRMPLFALKKLHVQGLQESTLADDARAVGAEHGIEIAVDPEPDRNSFTRTDQYSFVQAGVPALAMKFGWTANSPEYKAWRQWLAQRYHSTADDLDQPVDKAAAAQFNSFLGDLARRVANNPGRPHYVESSFFHRFEK